MGARKFDWRRVQTHSVYTVEELCDLLRCGPETLKRILRDEKVPLAAEKSPLLVVGADIIPALRSQSLAKKMLLGQMFCMRCKEPSFPAGGMLDDIAESPNPPLLQGLCGCCGAVMCRRVSSANKSAFVEAAEAAANNVS